jgi:hypothetical protein
MMPLPGGLLSLTWAGLAPADRASFAWRLRRGRDASYLAPPAQIQPGSGRTARDLGPAQGAATEIRVRAGVWDGDRERAAW